MKWFLFLMLMVIIDVPAWVFIAWACCLFIDAVVWFVRGGM